MGRRGRMFCVGLGVLVGNGWVEDAAELGDKGKAAGCVRRRLCCRYFGLSVLAIIQCRTVSFSRRNQSLRNKSGSLAIFAASADHRRGRSQGSQGGDGLLAQVGIWAAE